MFLNMPLILGIPLIQVYVSVEIDLSDHGTRNPLMQIQWLEWSFTLVNYMSARKWPRGARSFRQATRYISSLRYWVTKDTLLQFRLGPLIVIYATAYNTSSWGILILFYPLVTVSTTLSGRPRYQPVLTINTAGNELTFSYLGVSVCGIHE